MTNSGRPIDLGGGISGIPGFAVFRIRLLKILGILLVLILLMASTTSIPTGNVGVLTLFGKVTGDVLGEGIHLINPLKSVQKLSVQTQSVKESANTPSNEGLMLALDTSLLFRLDASKAADVYQKVGRITLRRSWSRRCARPFAVRLRRTAPTRSTPMRAI